MSAAPVTITRRGPNRSTSQPRTGPDRPCTITNSENAPARTERLQPKSRRSATRKTEYEYQMPYVSPSVTNVTATAVRPPAAIVGSSIRASEIAMCPTIA